MIGEETGSVASSGRSSHKMTGLIGVSQNSLMVGGFQSKAFLALWEEVTDPSAVRCGGNRLSCCLIVGIHTSGISIPLSLLMLLGWSLIWIASLTLQEYQWGSRSINLTVPERIMPDLIGVLRNGRIRPFEHANKTRHYPLWDEVKS